MLKAHQDVRYTLHPVSRFLLALLVLGCALFPAVLNAEPSPQELLDGGRVDEVLRVLASPSANNAAAFNYRGRAYYALEDWDMAVVNCERAVQMEPKNAMFQLWLGRSYGEKASVASPLSAFSLARKAVAAFSAAHNLDHHNVAISRDLAEYYVTAPPIVGGGYDKALALATEITADHPSDAARIRAMVLSNQGRQSQAENEYVEAIRLSNYSAFFYIEFARFLNGHKLWNRFQQTIELAMKASSIQPGDRYDAAELLLRTNRNLDLAAQQMRTYIESGRTDEADPLFRAHFLLGEILRKKGDSTQAAVEYKAALALASSYRPAAEALHRLG